MAVPISYNFRNLVVRRSTTLMTALGIALTVAVLVGIGTLVQGLRSSLLVQANPLHLIVMRQGSTAELVSLVQRESFDVLKFEDGIAQLDGEPMISHEVVTVVNLERRGDPSSVANISVRGLSPMGIKMRDDAKLVEGRWFEPGKREFVVGAGVHAGRANTSLGDRIFYGKDEWEVVGIFSAGNSPFNSEIWADGVLATADLGRGSTGSSILIRGGSLASANAIKNRVGDDQRLKLEAEFETEYYDKQMATAGPVMFIGMFVAVIMAVGSCFAAMNTMYAAVANRAREIGVLRLLGFSRTSILGSFMVESVMIAILGGLLGCLLVMPLHGLDGRIGNFSTFAESTFEFEISPMLLGVGMAFAGAMGVAGGLLPSWGAARRRVLHSLGER